MRRQSLLILAAILFGVPLGIALIAMQTGMGTYSIISLAVILITSIVLLRIWLGTGFTLQQGRSPEPPPERELIADADRPTMRIGLIVLALMVLVIIIAAVVLAIQVNTTPDPDLQQAEATSSFLSGPGLPLVAVGLGSVAVLATILFTRRSESSEAALDWREMLRPEDAGAEDVSWWVDQLSDDE